jgi:hypothetical protein
MPSSLPSCSCCCSCAARQPTTHNPLASYLLHDLYCLQTPPDSAVVCLMMDRERFEALLGPLAQVMHAVNAKREALRRQKNASRGLRQRMQRLERRCVAAAASWWKW